MSIPSTDPDLRGKKVLVVIVTVGDALVIACAFGSGAHRIDLRRRVTDDGGWVRATLLPQQ